MSSAASRSKTEPLVLRSGGLSIFPSFEDVRMVLHDFSGPLEDEYMAYRLQPTRRHDISAFYITCKSENPRSFVKVTRTNEPLSSTSGECSVLDFCRPPWSDKPSSIDLSSSITSPFTDASIMNTFKNLDSQVMDPEANTSPELKKLWSTIMSNRGWVASVITIYRA
ncbi:hypothetical protein EHS25_007237 [Saitozyma podzolica]|uniref:Uncharacterized protein n=1 Tax=Saitozyma podzolica TaxID=1890683 RepID=A0A427XN02_9TREE|nr:hypothetical protein EHS25_007237 [Saitozyma podzolica]